MFDKNLFDRNAFDRSVSSDGITSTLLGASHFETKLTVRTSLPLRTFSGSGALAPGLRMLENVGPKLTGAGAVKDTTIILRRSTTVNLSGQGVLTPNLTVRTPISAKLSGNGSAKIDNRMFLYRNMKFAVTGVGSIVTRPVFTTEMDNIRFSGGSHVSGRAALQLPLTISPTGDGTFVLRRLGALNENVIELIGLNLMPGESVTIDTDLLQVLLGAVEDVSSVTAESVFFELNPGLNDITVSTDVDGQIDVTAIWQNRWL